MTDAEQLCPNCCTPWKCNGPHLSMDCPECDRKDGVIAQLIADCERLEDDRDAALRSYRRLRREQQVREAP